MTKIQFRYKSGGAAYDFKLGFIPTKVTVENKTKWATDATVVRSIYHMGDAAGYAYCEITDDTGVNRSIVTTNGFTLYGESDFPANYLAITGITAVMNPVVTVAATTGWSTGDTVVIKDVVGMLQINDGIRRKITVIDGTTFSIDDLDASAFTAYASGGYVYNITKNVTDGGGVGITLGTSVVGANDDWMVLEAENCTNVYSLGSIA